MNVPDPTETRLYRKHGLTGLRWFERLWFLSVYAVLAGLGMTMFTFLIALPQHEPLRIGAIGLLVSATGLVLLTKMFREFRAGIRAIESDTGS